MREPTDLDLRNGTLDRRDRLILALYAQLKAERETREAIEWAAREGDLSPQVLEAMAADPVPVVTREDLDAIDQRLERDRSLNGEPQIKRPRGGRRDT